MKNIYRIEIGTSKTSFWIGKDLELVSDKALAVPVSHDEHMFVMEKIQCEAIAYIEGGIDYSFLVGKPVKLHKTSLYDFYTIGNHHIDVTSIEMTNDSLTYKTMKSFGLPVGLTQDDILKEIYLGEPRFEATFRQINTPGRMQAYIDWVK